MPKTVPMPPSAGPPATCPIASDWFEIDSTVARTLESVMFWLTQVTEIGDWSERVSR